MGTEHNVADVGTRAEKVSIDDIGPNSRYENGDSWMRLDLEEAVSRVYLRPTDS